ncbi:MAG: trypsin-like serine peptidase, partial [Candidatus Hydrogenedens sp.]
LLYRPYPTYTYTGMTGKKFLLKQEATGKQPLRIAVEEKVEIEGRLIFNNPQLFSDGNYYAVGEFRVEEAEGIRLILDVSKLSEDDRIWLIIPDLFIIYGPYPQREDVLSETWLPSVTGESAILVLQTKKDTLPEVKVVAFQFYYLSSKDMAKALPCPLPSPCVDNTEYQQVTTAVGRIDIPVNGGIILCSGTLLNVPDTSELEPYFITAHHCFEETDIRWNEIEVIWDFRVADCEDYAPPNENTCPRTYGAENLAESLCLDGQFLRLKGDVPVGEYGRAYAGWNSGQLSSGMTVYGAHHPEGTFLKSAIGNIKRTEVDSCMDSLCMNLRYYTIEVLWKEGITSQGSSGSGLFCQDLGYQLVGMLSNGPTHSCIDRSENYDYFASFRYFYPQIRCYLKPETDCASKADCDRFCFFKYMLTPNSQELQFFRDVRLWLTQQGDWGKELIRFYYKQSPTWIKETSSNPSLQSTIKSILKGK